MEHIAIDLGGRKSQVCVRESDGSIKEERLTATGGLGAYLASRPPARVVMETCAEAFAIADRAKAAGHEVRVVPATLVKALGVGARRTKTDRRDARVLSEVSCRIDLPSVHIPTEEARRRRALCASRDSLVSARVQMVNHVRGWARTQLVRMPKRHMRTFAEEVQALCAAQQIALPAHIERVLVVVEELTQQITAADKELAELAKADAVCRRLMTVPGVGPVTSVRFVAAVDDPSRFASAHAVESYLGLVPGERTSCTAPNRLGITKAGPPAVRWVLVQAAWSLRRYRPEQPLALWSLEVEKRRGRQVAIVALARKLAGILYAIWRDQSSYEPRATAQPVPTVAEEAVVLSATVPLAAVPSRASSLRSSLRDP